MPVIAPGYRPSLRTAGTPRDFVSPCLYRHANGAVAVLAVYKLEMMKHRVICDKFILHDDVWKAHGVQDVTGRLRMVVL
jgi:hypothetical protein